jgi:hypothetical protein
MGMGRWRRCTPPAAEAPDGEVRHLCTFVGQAGCTCGAHNPAAVCGDTECSIAIGAGWLCVTWYLEWQCCLCCVQYNLWCEACYASLCTYECRRKGLCTAVFLRLPAGWLCWTPPVL